MAINQRELATARAKATRTAKVVQISDGLVPKLYARAYPTGRVVFVHRQNLASGRSTLKSIGDLSDQFTIEDARQVARDRNNLASTGIDLKAKEDAEARKLEALAASTQLAALVEGYLAVNAVGKSSSYAKEQRQVFGRYVVASIGADTLVADITVAQCERCYLDLVAVNRLHTGRKVFAMAKRFFDKMVVHGHLDQSPMKHLKFEHKLRSRRVRLSIEDGVHLWHMSEDLNPVPRGLLRMLILTGQRRTQMAMLEHSEVDYSKKIITVPPHKTKNKEPHVVHLSDLAIATLRSVPRVEDKKYVFHTKKDTYYGFTGGLKKAINRRLMAERITIGPDGSGDWRLHDLRKLCAVGLRDLGHSMDVIERILHHVSNTQSGLLGTYHLGELLPERKQAMEDWGKLLAEQVNGAAQESGNPTVVSLHRNSTF